VRRPTETSRSAGLGWLADVPEEVRNAYLLRHAAVIRVLETIYRQVGEGVLGPEALDVLPPASSPLFKDAWMALRESYAPDFRRFFEARYGFESEGGVDRARTPGSGQPPTPR
jgi:hypothetical protein